ncbi:MAG: hypothetical protein WAV38_25830, partial [Xanthobacteraceae bacterium]
PFTVSVNEFPPGATDTGLIACTNGTGMPPAPAIALGDEAAAIIKSINPEIASCLRFPCRRACKRILISSNESRVFRFATNDPVRFGVALLGNPIATEWHGEHYSYKRLPLVNSQNRTSNAEMKFDSRIGTALGMERQAVRFLSRRRAQRSAQRARRSAS